MSRSSWYCSELYNKCFIWNELSNEFSIRRSRKIVTGTFSFSLLAVMKLYVYKRIAWYETTKSDNNVLDTKDDECL